MLIFRVSIIHYNAKTVNNIIYAGVNLLYWMKINFVLKMVKIVSISTVREIDKIEGGCRKQRIEKG